MIVTLQEALPAGGPCGPHVFIAHAGEQKQGFVDLLRVLLRDVHHLTVFVDEWSLRPNDDAPDIICQNLRTAAVGEGDTILMLLCMVYC